VLPLRAVSGLAGLGGGHGKILALDGRGVNRVTNLKNGPTRCWQELQ
jgi:hypothetical protein